MRMERKLSSYQLQGVCVRHISKPNYGVPWIVWFFLVPEIEINTFSCESALQQRRACVENNQCESVQMSL